MATLAELRRYVIDLSEAVDNLSDEFGYVETAVGELETDGACSHCTEALAAFAQVLGDLAECDADDEYPDEDLAEIIRRARQALRDFPQ